MYHDKTDCQIGKAVFAGTTSDFKDLCKSLDIKICREIPLTNEGDYLRWLANLWPNLFASNSIFVISK